MISNRKKDEAGFTLVELIVVIAIVALLATIAVPLVSGYVNDAQESSCFAQRGALVRQYEADYASASVNARISQQAAQDLAAAAAAKLGGTGDYPSVTGLCASGGTYTLRVLFDKITVVCSEHGISGLPNKVPSLADSETVEKLREVLKNRDHIDSTATGASTMLNEIIDFFNSKGIDLSELNINSWAVKKENHKYPTGDNAGKSYPIIYWTDLDVSKYKVGDKVRVIRYNDGTGTFTAGYMTLESNKLEGGDDYNRMKIGTWEEYDGQNDNTKMNYPDTVDIFNGMPKIKD